MTTSGWSAVPADLLWEIIKRLPAADYIRFGGVCISWHAATAEKRQLPASLPWLLLLDVNCCGTGANSPIRFFSHTESLEYHLDIPHNLNGFTCIGSSNGWLLFLDLSSTDSEIIMFNPITTARATLPSIATLPTAQLPHQEGYPDPQRFIKVVVSSYKSSQFIAAAIRLFARKLAFARQGNKSWTSIDAWPRYGKFVDVIFYKDQLYGLTCYGCVVACDISDVSYPRVTLKLGRPIYEVNNSLSLSYLVESAGDLLLVWRGMKGNFENITWQVWRRSSEEIEERVETTAVRVFRMDHICENFQWVELESLNNYALFLGNNSSLTVSSLDFSELRRNCIYLTNVYRLGDCRSDLLIYNMEDKSLEPLLSLCMSELKRPQMWWFTPNLSFS